MQITRGESIFLDFVFQKGQIPDGYEAGCFISKNGNSVFDKALDVDDNAEIFLLRITSNDTLALEDGDYMLNIFVQNTAIGYKDFVMQEKLVVKGF